MKNLTELQQELVAAQAAVDKETNPAKKAEKQTLVDTIQGDIDNFVEPDPKAPLIVNADDAPKTIKTYQETFAGYRIIIPKSGTNMGRTMYVINGTHWTETEPPASANVVSLQDVDVDGVTYTNVVGFGRKSDFLTIEQQFMLASKYANVPADVMLSILSK